MTAGAGSGREVLLVALPLLLRLRLTLPVEVRTVQAFLGTLPCNEGMLAAFHPPEGKPAGYLQTIQALTSQDNAERLLWLTWATVACFNLAECLGHALSVVAAATEVCG